MEMFAGAASLAVRELVAGPPVRGRVVAVFPRCAYVELGGRLLALETWDGLRLPCALSLAAPASRRPLAAVRVGDAARAGDRSVSVGPVQVGVARWWAPHRPRGAADPGDLGLVAPGWDAFVLGLLGRGPGLTPAGDDVLAGLLLGLAGRADLRDPLAAAVTRQAAARTTWLSAELLRHAAAGRGVPAAVAVADALAGHGPADALTRALPALLAVGHTSGAALARGLLLAAETLAGRPRSLDRREAAA
jgi:hypothetical protein